jgi:hypothetical protein
MGCVLCLFVFLLFQWVLASAIQQVAQAGWSPLFRVMQGITAFFTPCVRYIYYILIFVTTLNHLFIWLDPEVVMTRLLRRRWVI